MKFSTTFFLLGFSSLAFASSYPEAEDAILKLTCTTQQKISSDNKGFEPDGSRTFNLTIYKKNQTFYIKEQSGTSSPTWRGGNLNSSADWTTIKSIVTVTKDEIYSSSSTKLNMGDTKGTHDLTINRLNGSIRKSDYYYGDKKLSDDRYLNTGTCEKTQNKF